MEISKLGLERGYKVLKRVIDIYIKQNDIKFIASEIAPNTFKGMKAYYNDHGQFLVFSGGDHGYLGADYNIKFRAVHDSMHLNKNLTFKFEDEKKLSDITILEFRSIAAELGYNLKVRKILGAIINAEIRGQIEFYEINKNYVTDQKQFINDYLKIT